MMTTLCRKCRHIPKPVHFIRSENFPYQAIGVKADIEARKDSCPLCRLIYNALYNNDIPYRVDDESDIGVIWNGEYYYFSASHGEDFGIKIAVVYDDENGIASAAQYARAIHGPRAELSRIKSWLDLCHDNHKSGSELQQLSSTTDSQVLPSRAIDIQEGCIVDLDPADVTLRYVALSYVWGEATQYMLLKENKDRLMTPGVLPSIKDQIPRTIRDAMAVVSELGIRYLWVDALCIVQDDHQDSLKEIFRMDYIYERSFFTLVAASGEHADAGLAVLHERKTLQQYATIWPGVRMTAIHDVKDVLRSVKYGTRGWTFQEQVLSSRIAVFTDSMVYFHCHECSWSEDSRADEQPRQKTKIGNPRQREKVVQFGKHPWMSYCEYLTEYSGRDLTNYDDRVNALMGILQRIRRHLDCQLVYGLMTDCFDWALQFHAMSSQRCASFPTYSWAGWKGTIHTSWPNGLDYNPSLDGSSSELYDPPKDDSEMEMAKFHQNAAKHVAQSTWIVWYERLPGDEPTLVTPRDCLPERKSYIAHLKKILFTRRGELGDDVEKVDATKELPANLRAKLPKQYSVLQFWTVSVHLRLRPFEIASEHIGDLFDSKDQHRGQLQLPHDLEPEDYGSVIELIVLSVTNDHGMVHQVSNRFYKVERLPEGPRDRKQPRFYRVMWIRTVGGISERVAMGAIHYRALRRPVEGKARWREVILG